jgi:hypothetical protein
VSLTDAARGHIVGKHPAMPGREADVRAAIESPDFVNADARYPRRENHYRRAGVGAPYLKGVVKYRPVPPQGTWIGEVVTAYPTRVVPPKEQHLWP